MPTSLISYLEQASNHILLFHCYIIVPKLEIQTSLALEPIHLDMITADKRDPNLTDILPLYSCRKYLRPVESKGNQTKRALDDPGPETLTWPHSRGPRRQKDVSLLHAQTFAKPQPPRMCDFVNCSTRDQFSTNTTRYSYSWVLWRRN